MAVALAAAALLACATSAFAQDKSDAIASPTLRANVIVTSDIVRIGDVIDNAGAAARIAIYRAPDPGTTGTLQVTQIINTLRAHQVIGVDTQNLREISVTRQARSFDVADIEQAVARALERRNGLGDAANISLTFDRAPGDIRLDAANSGALNPVAVRYDTRNNRFDVTFEIANEAGLAPTKLRFSGTAVETVEAAVLARSLERNEVVKSSDVLMEKRPKAEVGPDVLTRDRAVGMQARRQLRAGQALKGADVSKPDLVQRDQGVTLIYDTPGVHLTVLGKALEAGTEGDVVNVLNLQSKRTVSGIVVGRGRVAIVVAGRPESAQAAAQQNEPPKLQEKLQDKLQDKLSDSTSSPGAAPAATANSLANARAQAAAKPE
ncbi:flagellar basal body P-ring formation chaperone FlgA [Bradyrhizobium sp.]|uniref:flagellar basal body P-ring formation chaperone FlgA n=1 Tax=Bradyrhizobium sp. TaxID=376 RepID=UPI001DDC06C3|nr:flagellar basal body P-ring formation chaperone FlgA [Bradyrhizobium sp.]MBI5318727.1 flagellar basal body P-ring formation protein FlgA [Bradyrhizobium sp.]